MIPTAGEFRHDPDNGVWGDCHRACVASILEVEIGYVPHFMAEGPDLPDFEFERRVRDWMRSEDIPYWIFKMECDEKEAALSYMRELNPGLYYILGGSSPNDVGHSVVCLDGTIIYSPGGVEIVGPEYIDETSTPFRPIYGIEVIGARESLHTVTCEGCVQDSVPHQAAPGSLRPSPWVNHRYHTGRPCHRLMVCHTCYASDEEEVKTATVGNACFSPDCVGDREDA